MEKAFFPIFLLSRAHLGNTNHTAKKVGLCITLPGQLHAFWHFKGRNRVKIEQVMAAFNSGVSIRRIDALLFLCSANSQFLPPPFSRDGESFRHDSYTVHLAILPGSSERIEILQFHFGSKTRLSVKKLQMFL